MHTDFEDQAAGLRRLFQASPPEVFAVVPCCASVMPWVARQIAERAGSNGSLLALDEWAAFGNLADCLHASMRFDLLQAAQGALPVRDCLVNISPSFRLAAVARLAASLGTGRLVNQRVIATLRELQADFQEWVIVARPRDPTDLSLLVRAAPSITLVLGANPESVTLAYATIKGLLGAGQRPVISLVFAKPNSRESRAMAVNLQELALAQLGVRVTVAQGLTQAQGVRGYIPAPSCGPGLYIERLQRAASSGPYLGSNRKPRDLSA